MTDTERELRRLSEVIKRLTESLDRATAEMKALRGEQNEPEVSSTDSETGC